MNSGVLIGLIGILCTIFGIPITFIVARRSKQQPDLRYIIDFDVLLRPSDRLFDEGLYMTLADRKIDSLSRTRLAFWNQRGDTVHGADIVSSDRLRLAFPDEDQPLQTRVIAMSRNQIALAAEFHSDFKDCAIINFDFLDAGDGGIIEVIHRGTHQPELLGTIRGATSRSRGTADLGPNALSVVRQSWLSRTGHWLKKDKIRAGTMLISMPVFIGGSIYIGIKYLWAGGSLVNAHPYNLNTVKGQVAFVSRVLNTGYYNRASNLAPYILAFIMAILGVIASLYVMRTRLIPRIPTSIVVYQESSTVEDSVDSGS